MTIGNNRNLYSDRRSPANFRYSRGVCTHTAQHMSVGERPRQHIDLMSQINYRSDNGANIHVRLINRFRQVMHIADIPVLTTLMSLDQQHMPGC